METQGKAPPDERLTFESALTFLKQGYNIQREGWNGKGMYLQLKDSHPVDRYLTEARDVNTFGQMLPHIVMKTAGDSEYWGEGYSDFVPWLASQTDILASDWRVVES